MARIELRNCVIRFVDGFTGTAAVDQSITPPANTDTTLEIDTLADLPNSLTIIPVGVRFTVIGSSNTYTVTVTQANEIQTLDLDVPTAGDFTLTWDGEGPTAAIAYDATAVQIQAALELLANITAGDILVTGASLGPFTIEYKGTYLATNVALMTINGTGLTNDGAEAIVETHPGATTWKLTFTPALATADGIPANDAVITLLPQILDIKIGEGNVTYTEASEYEYDLDRGVLDSVRAGNQVPLDVSFDFVYEFITTYTGEAIAPMDALKGIGGAALWISSATDLCEPYAIDVIVIHTPLCTTSAIETTTFPDFRSESREPDVGEASIAVSGRCNVVQPIVERTAQ